MTLTEAGAQLGLSPATPRPRGRRSHECVCPTPGCDPHYAAEWGAGEPDTCASHGHGRPPLDVDALAVALHAQHDDYRCGGPRWHAVEAAAIAQAYRGVSVDPAS